MKLIIFSWWLTNSFRLSMWSSSNLKTSSISAIAENTSALVGIHEKIKIYIMTNIVKGLNNIVLAGKLNFYITGTDSFCKTATHLNSQIDEE